MNENNFKPKFVKKEKKNKEIFRIAIDKDLLSRLKHVREIAKKEIDVNKTIENKIYSIVIGLEKKYAISSNDWKHKELCPKCDSVLRLVTGKNGAFLGCSSYPKCTFTKGVEK